MMRTWRSASALVVFGAFVGCGGTEDQGSCGRVPPCGGDIEGIWASAGSCYDANNFLSIVSEQLGLSCPAGTSLTISSSTTNRDVSASFSADGTYSGTSTWTGGIAFDVPSACHVSTSCADLATAIGTLVDPSNGFVGTTCEGTADCSCDITAGGTASESGTYTTSGTTIETTTSAGAVNDTPYCVSGSLLHLDSLVGGQVTSDTLLTRR